MPSGITGVDISSGLSRMLGLQGKFSMAQDEIQVAVLQVATLDRSPFQLTKPCGASDRQGAVVAENSYVGVLPSPGVILAIDRIEVSTLVTTGWFVQRLTAANLVTMGAPFAITQLRDFNNIEQPAGAPPRTASTLEVNSFAGVLGDQLAHYRTLTNTPGDVAFPAGYFLYGDDPSGTDMLAVVTEAANIEIIATFFCREFRLP